MAAQKREHEQSEWVDVDITPRTNKVPISRRRESVRDCWEWTNAISCYPFLIYSTALQSFSCIHTFGSKRKKERERERKKDALHCIALLGPPTTPPKPTDKTVISPPRFSQPVYFSDDMTGKFIIKTRKLIQSRLFLLSMSTSVELRRQ
jgi:hypothetical protein